MTYAGPFARFLAGQGFVALDGGLATALESAGHVLDTPLWSARLLLEAPDAIRAAHLAYLEAGADCVTTASYQASFEGFAAAGLDEREAEALLRRSVQLARDACGAFWSAESGRSARMEPIVAASAGPYGAYLADGSEYRGRYAIGRSALVDFHRRRLHVLADTVADLVAFETIPSSVEAEIVASLLGEVSSTWAWMSFTCADDERLRDGSPLAEAVHAALAAPRLAGIGINCTAPRHVAASIDTVRSLTDLPVIAYPNSGEVYDARSRRWVGTPAGADWVAEARVWLEHGARVIGGCCRVGPAVIRELRQELDQRGGAP
ncbi:MAG: homocysteine S-methyltransferase [Gemmatimonadales bacterium]